MKPRWLRHMIPIPSPWPIPIALEGVGERVRAAVQLVEGERAAFVDDRRRVGVVDRRSRDAERRRGPPAQESGADLRGLVGADQAEDPGLVQHLHLEG